MAVFLSVIDASWAIRCRLRFLLSLTADGFEEVMHPTALPAPLVRTGLVAFSHRLKVF